MLESLDMIANKIARIVNGDPYYKDSWQDIAGYAQLIVNKLDKMGL
jgi:sulfur carrier protein ThiS